MQAIADLLGEFHEPYRTELERDLTASFDAAEELLDHLGSTVADASEWTAHIEARTTLSELGWEPVIEEASDQLYPLQVADVTRRLAITGPCKVPFADGMRRLYETRYPNGPDAGPAGMANPLA